MDAFVRLSVSMCCTDVYTTVLAELFLTFSNATNVSSFMKPKTQNVYQGWSFSS